MGGVHIDDGEVQFNTIRSHIDETIQSTSSSRGRHEMSSCIRVLSTQSIDSTPSLLVVSPDGSKTLINCGEGSQRQFLEYSQRISSVDRICVTHISHDALGGLPGLILTAADATMLSSVQHQQNDRDRKQQNQRSPSTPTRGNNNNGDDNDDDHDEALPGLEIVGPTGIQAFLRSLRHFMRRDAFKIQVREGSYVETPKTDKQEKKNKSGKGDRNHNPKGKLRVESIAVPILDPSDEDLTRANSNSNPKKRQRCAEEKDTSNVTPPPLLTPGSHSIRSTSLPTPSPSSSQSPQLQNNQRREVLSFIFTTPPIQGKFLADKAKELGIPKGPLYGQLKAGKSVVFQRDGKEIKVESCQVVESGNPGVGVAVLCYPSIDVLRQLRVTERIQDEIKHSQSTVTTPTKNGDANRPTLQLIVHMTSTETFESDEGSEFRSLFSENVKHMFVRSDNPTDLNQQDNKSSTATSAAFSMMTPFHAAAIGAHSRFQVAPTVFTAPLPHHMFNDEDDSNQDENQIQQQQQQQNKTLHAVPLLEYALLPLSKQGFQNQNVFIQHWKMSKQEGEETLKASGAVDLAKSISTEKQERERLNPLSGDKAKQVEAEILFTGTGSAIPCKHRNVSGIYVRMENGNSMLLDVGEGTVGQILRAKQDEDKSTTLSNIKAVWISHPHADHHLGILRLLAERARVADDPLIIIAPNNLRNFLSEYGLLESSIVGSYSFLDCRDISTKAKPMFRKHFVSALLDRLRDELGITSCTAIPVAHCRNSFAVLFHGTSFGSLAYSGDCRPSRTFSEEARGVDILIHEATFADGMEAEASLKRHCTVGEAIDVARQMEASTLLLTHFSQRYPNIPPLPTFETDNKSSATSATEVKPQMRIVPCFDLMKITKSNIEYASKITPALQLLYPDHDDDEDECDEDEALMRAEAKAALETPGLFANPEIL